MRSPARTYWPVRGGPHAGWLIAVVAVLFIAASLAGLYLAVEG
jgi:hypothetical protein